VGTIREYLLVLLDEGLLGLLDGPVEEAGGSDGESGKDQEDEPLLLQKEES